MATSIHARRTWDDRLSLTLARRFALPPAGVWPAVLASADVEPVVGGDVRCAGEVVGRVLGLQAPHLLVCTAGDEVYRWELESTDEGCRLTVNDIVPAPDRLTGSAARLQEALEAMAEQLGEPRQELLTDDQLAEALR